MPYSPSTSLVTLLGERGPCPVCDEFDCNHQFYGDDHYRFGDPMSKHPRMQGRTIPAPTRIVDPDTERVAFGVGDLMTPAEAERYGVTKPAPAPKGKRKGERSRKPSEDRSREHMGEDRAS